MKWTRFRGRGHRVMEAIEVDRCDDHVVSRRDEDGVPVYGRVDRFPDRGVVAKPQSLPGRDHRVRAHLATISGSSREQFLEVLWATSSGAASTRPIACSDGRL